MEKWFCYKCKEEMVEADIQGSYMDIDQTLKGLKCPKCGIALLTEEQGMAASQGEEELEAKA